MLTGVHSNSSSNYFNLETLWFLAQTAKSTSFSDYFKAATEQKVGKVSFVDRPQILAWLKGESDTLTLLDPLAAPSDVSVTPLPQATSATTADAVIPTKVGQGPAGLNSTEHPPSA